MRFAMVGGRMQFAMGWDNLWLKQRQPLPGLWPARNIGRGGEFRQRSSAVPQMQYLFYDDYCFEIITLCLEYQHFAATTLLLLSVYNLYKYAIKYFSFRRSK
ncbi:hypothetical protein L195_g032905 [Trifolium pratense]|uniref:Uncharacterized protein n=1 Tax=Trifolium pratense TaxID=57577 RepID=A0A2K3LEJ7_TRIPR|nr:hypothetical protein L195_g032905 [Trifolium pratense]